MNALNIRNLSYRYSKENILENVNLSLPAGEFLVIIGPNGGGKSTFLKIVLGLLPIQSGSVEIFGHAITSQLPYLGYVPQDSDQIKNFPVNVIDTAMMGFYRPGVSKQSKKEIKKQALQALELTGMASFTKSRLNELSTGQRQRVLLARAIAPKPKLLILDEPVSGIDPGGQKAVMNLLKNFQPATTIIFVSHDLSVIPGYATAVACINHRLYFHAGGEITGSLLSEAYGNIGSLTLVSHHCDCGGLHE